MGGSGWPPPVRPGTVRQTGPRGSTGEPRRTAARLHRTAAPEPEPSAPSHGESPEEEDSNPPPHQCRSRASGCPGHC